MADSTQQKLRVLVSGAGIAGPCLAWWLTQDNAKHAVEVTIVERAPRLRPAGQNIDIRGPAVKVIERMGMRAKIQASHTGEKGIQIVDAANHVKAAFPMSEGNNSFTSEFEVTRSDLADIFYNATTSREGVRYIFDETVSGITDEADGAQVEFANGTPASKYDYVVGADGLGSKVRRLVFSEAGANVIRNLGQFMMFFTTPKGPTDTDMARWHNVSGRRILFVRPDNRGTTRVCLSIISGDPRLREVLKHGAGADSDEMARRQKELTQDLFKDAGWETERILRDMLESDDFYMQEVAQVVMGQHGFAKGHVALLGDAGYCPSPISGMGTSLAIQGAYYLAGEILKHGKDAEAALRAYQASFAPVVAEAQKLAPGAPKVFAPDTAMGIRFTNVVLKGASLLMKLGLGRLLGGDDEKKQRLPEYFPPAAAA